MSVATVAGRFEFPAQQVWDYISWHGMGRLAGEDGPFKRVDFSGDKPAVGITKYVHLAQGLPVCERLEFVDEGAYTYRYRIIDDGDLPITDYAGYVRVAPCEPNACHLKIECHYTPVSVSAQEWSDLWSSLEYAVMDQIRARLAAEAA